MLELLSSTTLADRDRILVPVDPAVQARGRRPVSRSLARKRNLDV